MPRRNELGVEGWGLDERKEENERIGTKCSAPSFESFTQLCKYKKEEKTGYKIAWKQYKIFPRKVSQNLPNDTKTCTNFKNFPGMDVYGLSFGLKPCSLIIAAYGGPIKNSFL